MAARCEGCGSALEGGWVACPHCGRPTAGKESSEKLVRVVTQVGIDLLEAALLEAESKAEEKGENARAAQLALARNLAKDVAPKIADAVTTYLYQRRVLESNGEGHRSGEGRGGKRALAAASDG
jgi:uncharacterized Zn finger protein (UPF0148 family)